MKTEKAGSAAEEQPKWLGFVQECVKGVRFGKVEILIHEGRVTQVDATQRTRIETEPQSTRRHS